VLPTLQHAADRDRFPSLAAAHAALVMALRSDLAARGARLTAVAPTTYTDAWGDQEYLRELGRLLPPDVPLFWTGVDVVSPDVTGAQAAAWTALTGHRPLVWDNYPVNDFARWRLFLGPLRHRTADLATAVLGVIANPMNEAHASMIPLATLARYAADPASYDPAVALDEALLALYGDAAALVRPFVDAYGDYAEDPNAFEPLFLPSNGFDVATVEGQLAALTAALQRLDSAAPAVPGLSDLHRELVASVRRTQQRLDQMVASGAWARTGDSLVYRAERDRVKVKPLPGTITVDGDPSDWGEADWAPVGDGSVARYAVGVRGDSLYIAVRVAGRDPRVEAGDRIAVGDHVAVIVQSDADGERRKLSPEDRLILISPDEHRQLHVPFSDFMAKYFADNEHFRWSEFFLSTFAQPAGRPEWQVRTARQHAEWTTELSASLEGRRVVRVSLTVSAQTAAGRRTDALPARNYPGNPATYVELVVAP